MGNYRARSILEPAGTFGLVRTHHPPGVALRLAGPGPGPAAVEISFDVREHGRGLPPGTDVVWGVPGVVSEPGPGLLSFSTDAGMGRTLTVRAAGIDRDFDELVRSIPAIGSPELFDPDPAAAPVMREIPTMGMAAEWLGATPDAIDVEIVHPVPGEAPCVDIRARLGAGWALLGIADGSINSLRQYALTAHDPSLLDEPTHPELTIFGEKPTGRSQVMWKAFGRFWHLFAAVGLEYSLPAAARVQASMREGHLT